MDTCMHYQGSNAPSKEQSERASTCLGPKAGSLGCCQCWKALTEAWAISSLPVPCMSCKTPGCAPSCETYTVKWSNPGSDASDCRVLSKYPTLRQHRSSRLRCIHGMAT